ncbi:MAG: ATP-binding cassette domain-containing protein [Betaproteobacteria bacterium]|nr:ATP-binding cassette domain-containing protein [Betaproteobacteria bacterium]
MEATRAPLLELEEISVRIGAVRALSNLNGFVRKGERFAIVGAERAGKTTVLESIAERRIPHAGALPTPAAPNTAERIKPPPATPARFPAGRQYRR